ncbi:MAG: NAD(P)-binding domain-containing protein, partial [Nitratireductor sp.]|nr:NAD(P)-binding domain-containing protein [Nitratireductor sp.]
MRFIIVGVGAIGGTLAVTLANAGYEVAAVARGEQLRAINENGLTLKTPMGDSHARFDCAEDPAALGLRSDDIILLCIKSQNTEAALADLLAAGAVDQPIFCMQNGVANERMALRYFANVYGVAVMLPSEYLTPGIVCAFGTPQSAIFDLGRYPAGTDETVDAAVVAFNAAGLVSSAREDVMAYKYGKLLL